MPENSHVMFGQSIATSLQRTSVVASQRIQILANAVARPSVVHPTQPVRIFRNVPSPFSTVATPLTFTENFTEIVPGKPLWREG